MSEFKDRVGSGLNKRILEVESVERNQAGEISKIYAKVSRNDTASISGTALNATTLNAIINDMIITKIKEALENYHENGLAVLETAEATILFDGSSAMYDSISIDVSEAVRIVVENNYQEYFSVSAPNTSLAGKITIDITAIDSPETSDTTEFDFIVKLISQATNEMIKKVTCTVTLQVPSTTPDD
ncbi:MAG: hypothetical protein KIC61_07435 [Staphylococcus sp.]|jgi:hypothetical protein|nr:hypothetical protein [Staphylococcus sp.]